MVLGTWLPASAGLLFLWGMLLKDLCVDWTVNAQYAYGWAVPFLCLFLVWRRLPHRLTVRSFEDQPRQSPNSFGNPLTTGKLAAIVVLLAAWPFVRFLEQANPDWRLVAWAQALTVATLTWLILPSVLGFRLSAFPIYFFLVAIPWPTLVEMPLIQKLSHGNAAITVALVDSFGVPAIQHGSTIEVGTGYVGIDEACSGIRSFQASLMLALFFGEQRRLSLVNRLVLVGAGFFFAFGFNVLRTTTLTLVAAKQGIAAIARWHDPAGVLITLGCFCCLLLVARMLSKTSVRLNSLVSSPADSCVPLNSGFAAAAASSGRPMLVIGGLGILFWSLLTEVGVEGWYRSHEKALPPKVAWLCKTPSDKVNFASRKLPEKAREMLRFNNASSFGWIENSIQWNVIFLEWGRGRVTPQLARFHNPEVCLSASGKPHETMVEARLYEVKGLRLPFRIIRVESPNGPSYLFYCIWEDRAGEQRVVANTIDYQSRLERAWRGQRNLGQRALEISVQGATSFEQAESLFRVELGQLVVPTT